MKSKNSVKEKINSIQFKLFSIICLTSVVIITVIIFLNNLILEYTYTFTKMEKVKKLIYAIDSYYSNQVDFDYEEILSQFEIENNLDILILDENGEEEYCSRNGLSANFEKMNLTDEDSRIVYERKWTKIYRIENITNNTNVIVYKSKLNSDKIVLVRLQLIPIRESVNVSNQTLVLIGISMVVVSAICSLMISRKFAIPIVRLNRITKRVAKLDFSEKYRINDGMDEINELGRNINEMSDKLEKIISQLRQNNNELEKDILEKSKIDEMRQKFISDVSHELKTPIGLIQGYAEGLIENVNTDEESKKFYAEVIVDEANKMDRMVKQLLELMKIEYSETVMDDTSFNIKELINEEIKRHTMEIEEKKIEVEYEQKDEEVYASQRYIEQVIGNYISNAIKHCEKVNDEKKIIVRTEEADDKLRVYVYNTGKKIPTELQSKIWDRFYKVDEAREREKGGTGIGLSIVKAIMQRYGNDYGVKNYKDGVEFYCEIDRKKSVKQEKKAKKINKKK